MRRSPKLALALALGLAGCSPPAPYQTYSPGEVPAPTRPETPMTVYGATTTTPDMLVNFGEPTPEPTPPPAPAPLDQKTQAIAICYNRLWNSPAAVRSAAVAACGNTGEPRVVNQNLDIDACPLLTPTHAVFACAVAPSPPAK